MAFKTSDAAANSMLDALNDLIGSEAIIELCEGPQPVSLDTSTKTLASLVGASTFGSVSNRTLTANPITRDEAADATGVAGYIRISTAAGVAVCDLAVGSEVTLPTPNIVEGQPFEIKSLTIRIG